MRKLFYYWVAVVLAISPARAQSEPTLAGMAAYNRNDFTSAYQFLRQAADGGDPEGLVNLGYLYARGQGVKADQQEALRLYEASAKAESSEGMNALGYKYEFGTGVPKDHRLAAYWFCEAVTRSNWRAMNNLGLVLVSGGVEIDLPEARNLWEQAAALGHPNAMFNLAVSYLNGPDKDLLKADALMLQAAQLGHPDAQRYMRIKGYSGSFPTPIAPETAMKPEPKGATGHTKQCELYIS